MDITGYLVSNSVEDLLHRLGAGLTSSNTHVTKIFLPTNTPTEGKDKCISLVKNWIRVNELNESSVKIFWVDNISTIISDILEEEKR
jgi:hypothetical protein